MAGQHRDTLSKGLRHVVVLFGVKLLGPRSLGDWGTRLPRWGCPGCPMWRQAAETAPTGRKPNHCNTLMQPMTRWRVQLRNPIIYGAYHTWRAFESNHGQPRLAHRPDSSVSNPTCQLWFSRVKRHLLAAKNDKGWRTESTRDC